MTGWIIAIVLALAALGALVLLGKAPRKSWEALAATLVFGFIGFYWQARPELPGAPKQAEAPQGKIGGDLVTVRQKLSGQGPIASNHWVMTADALTRQGDFSNAAGYLLGGIEENPRDGQTWLALANNLVGHADGALTPAALYAYRQAGAADPQAAGPPIFLGLALIQNGRPQEGRAMWAALLERAPADAPWRPWLVERLAMLDQLMAQDAAASGQKQPKP
jgi:cytochrome c-type biogenesis protein CcmH